MGTGFVAVGENGNNGAVGGDINCDSEGSIFNAGVLEDKSSLPISIALLTE